MNRVSTDLTSDVTNRNSSSCWVHVLLFGHCASVVMTDGTTTSRQFRGPIPGQSQPQCVSLSLSLSPQKIGKADVFAMPFNAANTHSSPAETFFTGRAVAS